MSVLDPKSVSQVTNPVEQRLLMAMADQEVDVADSIREWLRDGYDAWCSTAMLQCEPCGLEPNFPMQPGFHLC